MAKHFWRDIEDTRRRLTNGVVLRKGEPVYIKSVHGLNGAQFANIQQLPLKAFDEKVEEVPLITEDFEIRNLPRLGYVNHDDQVSYLVRQSIRNQFQCYHGENVKILGKDNVGFGRLLGHKGLVDMLRGKYPSLKTSFERLVENEDNAAVAFSKSCALRYDDGGSVILESRGRPVGAANRPRKRGAVFTLADNFHYLKEELEEQGIKLEA